MNACNISTITFDIVVLRMLFIIVVLAVFMTIDHVKNVYNNNVAVLLCLSCVKRNGRLSEGPRQRERRHGVSMCHKGL